MADPDSPSDSFVASVIEDYVTNCWGCGLRLLLPSYAPVFKCGWCGAITNQNSSKSECRVSRWRHVRDRCFLCILSVFMLFVICGGVWCVFPVVFAVSFVCGVTHASVTILLSISTFTLFGLSAFKCAGKPPSVYWGSHPDVGKGELENYTYCYHCCKPKSPRTHHCRTCGMCVFDMDHHCPFIGNCVGAANHRPFVGFLISAVISTTYASIMLAYTATHIWPSQAHRSSVGTFMYSSTAATVLRAVKDMFYGFLSSAVVSARGFILVYLFVASVSVGIGLSVLLWQQLSYIYEGKTYLSHLSLRGSAEDGEKSCQNLAKFFGCPFLVSRYLPTVRDSRKKHDK